MATLSDIFKSNIGVGPFTLQGFSPRTQILPNSGGIFSSMVPSQPAATPAPTPAPVAAPIFNKPAPVAAPVATPVATPAPTPVDMYAKYRDPKTGNVMSPEEYAIYLGNRVPKQKGTGDVPQYAGDALTNPNATDLTAQATNLNNARNDIATGTTDPYKVGSKSGIAYSPTELAAIEKAYAGIYDPALNDVFARLKTKKEEDQRIADREDKVFATNESIRAWKATTGTKGNTGTTADLFTQSQLNSGASRAGVGMAAFSQLDPDIANFFINPPTDVDEVTGKSYPMPTTFSNLVKLVGSGDMTAKEATDEIMGSNLPDTVKHYYIDQLPLTVEQKKGYFATLWGAITGQ